MNTKQELCDRLVQREVIYCVSALIDGIYQASVAMHHKKFEEAFGVDPEDVYELLQRRDFEEPGTTFIRDDADLDELQEIADHFGDWGDLLDKTAPQVVETAGEEGSRWSFTGSDTDFDDEDDAQEAAVESVLKQLRKAVINLVDDWNWIGENYDIEPEYQDCYEHWIVTSWLARRLEALGEVIGEVAGLTVWGLATYHYSRA